jgi:hypothetical protein
MGTVTELLGFGALFQQPGLPVVGQRSWSVVSPTPICSLLLSLGEGRCGGMKQISELPYDQRRMIVAKSYPPGWPNLRRRPDWHRLTV